MSSSRPPMNGREGHRSVSKPTLVTGLFVKVKFNNTLPDIPFDPKFIVNPLSISRYVDYQNTSLEQNSKHELLTPLDLGVDIDLVLPERYAIPDHPIHDAEDDRLINDDEPLLQSTKKSPRDKPHSQLHNKVVPWLKKTEYISTEYNRYGSSNEKTETKVGYNVRKNMKEDEIFLDRDSQIKAINQTFEAARVPIERHPTKSDVVATKEMPLFPDAEMWKYCFAHVKFDNEPADPSKADQMSQAIIRGAYDNELEENFVVYFLPTEITMADRLLDQNNGLEYTDKEYEYRSSREYTWQAKQDPNGDDFFFVFRDDCVYYNRLSMEVSLKKRRNKSQNATVSILVVKNREMNEEEIKGQADMLKQLNKPYREEEPNIDLTAQSLEQSYEEQSQARKEAENVPSADEDDNSSSSSQAGSSSSSESSSASSSSSSEEESEGEDNEEDSAD